MSASRHLKVLHETYCKRFIDSARNFDRCEWCGREGRKNRKGLCRSCNGVRKNLELLEKRTREQPSHYFLNWELRVANQMKRDCMAWGKMLSYILAGPVDALNLEHWLRDVAERVAKDKRIHFGTANMLAGAFGPAQRQVLAYLLWQVFAAEASHNRKNRAMGRAQRETLSAE
jgi:hypothetical protein